MQYNEDTFTKKNRFRSFFKAIRIFFSSLRHIKTIIDPGFEYVLFKAYLQNGLSDIKRDPRFILWFLANPGTTSGLGFKVPEGFARRIRKNIFSESATLADVAILKSSGDRVIVADKAPMRFPGASIDTRLLEIKETHQQMIPIHVSLLAMKTSNISLEDPTYVIEDELAASASYTISNMAEEMVIQGDGEGKPKGILKCYSNYKEWGSVVEYDEHLTYENLLKLKRLADAKRIKDPKFYMSSSTLYEIMTIKNDRGQYIIDKSAENNMPTHLFNIPIVINEYMDNVYDKDKSRIIPVMIGNMSKAYCLAERPEISVRRFDDSAYAEYDQVLFIMRYRWGGHPVDFNQMILLSNPVNIDEKSANNFDYLKPKVVKHINLDELQKDIAHKFDNDANLYESKEKIN